MRSAEAGIHEIKSVTNLVHRGELPSVDEGTKAIDILGQVDRRNNQVT